MSLEGQAVQQMLEERRQEADPLKHVKEGWCDSKGTVDEVRAKLQMRQEGVLKREREIAYSNAQKLASSQDFSPSTHIRMFSNRDTEIDRSSWGWSWLERWMAAKPWENRLMEEVQRTSSDLTPISKIQPSSSHKITRLKSLEPTPPSSVRVTRNHMTTRIQARPPMSRSSTSPSSELRYDVSSESSSMCTSGTPVSGADDPRGSWGRPSYMSMTESMKAKRRARNYPCQQSMDEVQFSKRLGGYSGEICPNNNAGSDPSLNGFSRPMNAPTGMGNKTPRKPSHDRRHPVL